MGNALYYLTIPWTQLRQGVHNSWGILNVWDLILLRPMPGGLLPIDHPFCTGIDPSTGEFVWMSNLLFKTERKIPAPEGMTPDEADLETIQSVGKYMGGMVARSARSEVRPLGRRNRMPPAVYYIHGAVHYNGGWLLFNDFAEAIRHLTDKRFRSELKRFVRREKREPLLVFREREVDNEAYGEFVGFVRTLFPWFANSNAARNAPVWGNTSTYPTINIVTGNWIREVRALATEEGQRAVVRSPVKKEEYFQGAPYYGTRETVLPIERLLARSHISRIKARGEKENVYFVDKRKLDEGFRYDPAEIPNVVDVAKETVKETVRSRLGRRRQDGVNVRSSQ